MIKFDTYSFEKAAEAVLMANPAVRTYVSEALAKEGNEKPTREEKINYLVGFMEGLANVNSKYGTETTFTGTFGFYVTVYKLSYTDGIYTHGAAATIQPHLVMELAKSIQKLTDF